MARSGIRRARDGDLDLLLLALEADLGDLATHPLFRDPFVAAFPAGHRLASRKSLRESDLDPEEILLLSDGHCLRKQVLGVCAAAGPAPRDEFRATSLPTLVQMVAGGSGTTLLPQLALRVEARNRDLGVVPFRRPAPARTMAEIGQLMLMGRRIYDPAIGRFLSQDPFFALFNQYSYTFGDPLDFSDADGSQARTKEEAWDNVVTAAKRLARISLIWGSLAASVISEQPELTLWLWIRLHYLGFTWFRAAQGLQDALDEYRAFDAPNFGPSFQAPTAFEALSRDATPAPCAPCQDASPQGGSGGGKGGGGAGGAAGGGGGGGDNFNFADGFGCAPANLGKLPDLRYLLLVLIPLQVGLGILIVRKRG